jgi:hypothetical protein
MRTMVEGLSGVVCPSTTLRTPAAAQPGFPFPHAPGMSRGYAPLHFAHSED